MIATSIFMCMYMCISDSSTIATISDQQSDVDSTSRAVEVAVEDEPDDPKFRRLFFGGKTKDKANKANNIARDWECEGEFHVHACNCEWCPTRKDKGDSSEGCTAALKSHFSCDMTSPCFQSAGSERM